jgi:hypothetical protein
VVRGSQEKLKTSGTLKPEEMSEDEYVMKRIQKGLLILGCESSNAKPQPKGRYDEPKPSAKEKIWKARQFRCQCGHSDRMHPDNYCAVSGCHCVKFDTRPKNKPEFKSGGLSTCRGRHGSKTEDLRMVEPKPENKEAKS